MAQTYQPSGWVKFVVFSYSAAVVLLGWDLLGMSAGDIYSYIKNSAVANAAESLKKLPRSRGTASIDLPRKRPAKVEPQPQADALTEEDRRELDALLGNL